VPRAEGERERISRVVPRPLWRQHGEHRGSRTPVGLCGHRVVLVNEAAKHVVTINV
jgi:hypothetical protein